MNAWTVFLKMFVASIFGAIFAAPLAYLASLLSQGESTWTFAFLALGPTLATLSMGLAIYVEAITSPSPRPAAPPP